MSMWRVRKPDSTSYIPTTTSDQHTTANSLPRVPAVYWFNIPHLSTTTWTAWSNAMAPAGLHNIIIMDAHLYNISDETKQNDM